MDRISVIVPIFNVENYLKKCIESILTQNYRNLEVILVDDGSTDNSGRICDYYASRDTRVKVVHKRNAGVSDARNTGIEIATGEYFIFLDGDDWLTKDILRPCYTLIKEYKLDLLIGAMDVYEEHTLMKTIRYPRELCGYYRKGYVDFLAQFTSKTNNCFWFQTQSIFKKDIIMENNLRYVNKYSTAEDCYFELGYLTKCKRIYLTNVPMYCYTAKREGSLMNTPNLKRIESQIEVFGYCINYFRENFRQNNSIIEYFARRIYFPIEQLAYLKEESEIKKVEELINEEWLQIVEDNKYRFYRFIWSTFGYYYGSKVILFFKNIRNKFWVFNIK